MNALYKSVLAILLIMAIAIGPEAWGGGLNRIAVMGPTGVGNGSDPDGPWLPENLAGKIQISGRQFEAGAEAMIPKFTYTNRWGKTWESKNIVHVLPYLSYGQRVDEDTVVGVDVMTEYGLGASFQRIYGTMDTQTLVAGTYIKPYIAKRLTDKLSIGVGLQLVNGQLTWRGPLDIGRHYLPIAADTRAMGYGVGYAVGLFYQPTERLALGVNYSSSVTVKLEGRTQVYRPIHLRDKIRAEFQFPDRLQFAAAWKPNNRWLLTSEYTYYGYSKQSLESVDIRFDKLLITKGVKTGWSDNYGLRFGASCKLNERWTVGGGFGYMSQAVPDKTADYMTPDVAGWSVAGRVKYSVSDKFDLTAGVSRGWGSNTARGREITADIWTVVLSGSYRF